MALREGPGGFAGDPATTRAALAPAAAPPPSGRFTSQSPAATSATASPNSGPTRSPSSTTPASTPRIGVSTLKADRREVEWRAMSQNHAR